MVRLAAGDRGEFQPLFEALWPLVSRFTRRALPPADADDAAQEAMMKVFRRASEFRAGGDVVSWTLGIAAYECLTVRRRAQRARRVDEPADLVDGSPSPEATAIANDLLAAAEEVLTSLRHEDREAILAALEGRGGRPALGAAVRKRLSRALARLRQAWRARHGAD